MSPRKKRHDYTWLSVHMSLSMKEAMTRLAAHEERSVSGMARRLMAEGLRARGIEWREGGEGDDERR